MPRRVGWQFIWVRVREAWSLLICAKLSEWTSVALSVPSRTIHCRYKNDCA
jgi:hypothetical protein